MNDTIKMDEKVVKETYDRLKHLLYTRSAKDVKKLNSALFKYARNVGELVELAKLVDKEGVVTPDKKLTDIYIAYLGTLFIGGVYLKEIAELTDFAILFDPDKYLERRYQDDKE